MHTRSEIARTHILLFSVLYAGAFIPGNPARVPSILFPILITQDASA